MARSSTRSMPRSKERSYEERPQSRRSSSRYEYDDDYRGRRMPSRDERGRFVDEDEDEDSYYSSRSRARFSNRGRAANPYRERDEEGRFVSDDYDDEYESRSRYEDEDEDDDADYRSMGSSRRGGRASSRSSRHGGWYGEPRRHARAAEEGWEHRSRRRSSGNR